MILNTFELFIKGLIYDDLWFKISFILTTIMLLLAVKKKPDINNNCFNLFLIYCYLSFYIYTFFFLRFNLLDKPINLKENFGKLLYLIKGATIIDTIVIIIFFLVILIIFLYLLNIFHKIFIKELIKRYIFLFTHDDKNTFFDASCFFYKILRCLTFEHIWITTAGYCMEIERNLVVEYKVSKKHYFIVFRVVEFIFHKLFMYIIIIRFFYELIYNNFILTENFNKLIFAYALFVLYKRISLFIYYTDLIVMRMLYNFYYKDRSVKYIDVPENCKDYLYKAIRNNLEENPKHAVYLTFEHIITMYCEYKSEDGIYYTNKNGDTYDETGNNWQDETRF